MDNRIPEDELEYRRYLRRRIRMRKRRRKVLIARALVALAGIVLVFMIFYGIGKLTGPIGSKGTKAKTTTEPKVTPLVVNVPDGYQEIYDELYQKREKYPEMDSILLNIGQYPIELLTLLSGNMETLSFVRDYPMHIDEEEASGGILEEELGDSIPLFQQWDKRWGYVKYGSNILAINGCGPTCISMVYTGLTGNTDKSPAEVADFCIDNNYYTEDAGTSWALMLQGAKKLGITAEEISVGADTVREKLEDGQAIICSMKPGDFTSTGHFIVLRGITDEGKILLNDPNSISRSQKEWELDTVLKQVKAVWAYSRAG